MELMPGFWPPRPSRFWNAVLSPLRRYYLHNFYAITNVEIVGAENLEKLPPGDGALIAPNHSHDSDPHVMMEVGHRLGRQLYFMAAWQVFLAHHGIDGWVMQRFGAFSVDREGCDRRAMRQASELLTNGQALVVFPEGEIYHTNERLTPLREGVAFMAVTSQRDLDKQANGRQVWVVPAAIRYRFEEDITPKLEASIAALESRFMLKPKPAAPLHERMIGVGEVLLTIKEKEQLGHSMDGQGDLPMRVSRLIGHILSKHETRELGKVHEDESVPVRVKSLRRHLLEQMCDEKQPDEPRRAAHASLEDLHLVLQLYSYPGDYIATKPTVERMAETIEKFEEDVLGHAMPKGKRSATVTLGEPLDVKRHTAARARAAAGDLTARLETSIRGLMTAG